MNAAHTSLDALIALQHDARGWSLLPRQPVTSLLSGRNSSRLRGRGLDFDELRAYLPGDDVRTIDWHVTARTKKPFRRVFTEERDRPVIAVVDQRSSMFFGTRRTTKATAAAECAALVAWKVLSVGDRIGGIVIGDDGLDVVAPRRSRNTVMRLLAAVVAKNAALRADPHNVPSLSPLDAALQRAAAMAPHDALIVVISDFVGAGPGTRELIDALLAHNDVLAVFVHDPFEAELPASGTLGMAGEGRTLELDCGDGGLRARYRGEFEARVAAVEALALRRQLPLLWISTAEQPALQVRAQIGQRVDARRR